MTQPAKPTPTPEKPDPASAVAAAQDGVVRLATKEWGKLGGILVSLFLAAAGYVMNKASDITSQIADLKAQNPQIVASIAELKTSLTEVKTDVKSSISRLELRQDKQDERMLNLERDIPRRNTAPKGADDE